MKFFLVFASFLVLSMAQRPMYAGKGPRGRPELASRFKDPNEESSSTVSVANRGADDATTPKIPVDALGDADLVNRLNQWPREHRPFWLLNADHIEASRNSQGSGNLQTRSGLQDERDSAFGRQPETRPIRPPPPRSSFLGPLTR